MIVFKKGKKQRSAQRRGKKKKQKHYTMSLVKVCNQMVVAVAVFIMCLVWFYALQGLQNSQAKSTDDLMGTNAGPPPLQESQGAVTQRSHHENTDWKSLLQFYCKGIRLDLPNFPCDPGVATCQRARGREGHSPSWQHRDFLAVSSNEKAA